MIDIYNIFKKLFNYFDRFRIIYDRLDNEPYLERYYLFLKDRKNFPFNIFLHKLLLIFDHLRINKMNQVKTPSEKEFKKNDIQTSAIFEHCLPPRKPKHFVAVTSSH